MIVYAPMKYPLHVFQIFLVLVCKRWFYEVNIDISMPEIWTCCGLWISLASTLGAKSVRLTSSD